MSEITIDTLFTIYNNEKRTGEYLPLDENFYEFALKGLEKIKDDNERINFKKLIDEIRKKRIQKLLIYIAYEKQIPNKLPKEEKELYEKIKILLSDNKIKIIKVLKDAPELLMPNGARIGPFVKDQRIVVTDENELEFILKNKLGEVVG